MNVVFVETDRCLACMSCTYVCSFRQAALHQGQFPNIFVEVDREHRKIFTTTCLQCRTALCIRVCPVGALDRDPETNAVVVNKSICIGCAMCVAACPFGNMHLDEREQVAMKCDLCGGNPKCVQACMAGALHYGSINRLAELKRKKAGLRLGIRAVPNFERHEK